MHYDIIYVKSMFKWVKFNMFISYVYTGCSGLMEHRTKNNIKKDTGFEFIFFIPNTPYERTNPGENAENSCVECPE